MWGKQKQQVAQGASAAALINWHVLQFTKLVFLNVALVCSTCN